MNRRIQRAATILTSLVLATACGDAAGPGGAPVDIQLAAQGTAPVGVYGPAQTVTAGLEVTALRMAVGQAGLGNVDQFGCIDCQGDSEQATAPRLVTVPLDGSPVHLETEMASAGSYAEIELELAPSGAPGDWPSGSALQITGKQSGNAFDLFVAVQGSSRHTLSAPVVISGLETASVSAVLEFPVREWFTGPGGAALDPTNDADRAIIVSNVRAYFYAPETSGAEG